MGEDTMMDSPFFDIVVIGGGVVDLGILRAATLAGHRCALVEKEPHILSKASGGIACTGVDDSGKSPDPRLHFPNPSLHEGTHHSSP